MTYREDLKVDFRGQSIFSVHEGAATPLLNPALTGMGDDVLKRTSSSRRAGWGLYILHWLKIRDIRGGCALLVPSVLAMRAA